MKSAITVLICIVICSNQKALAQRVRAGQKKIIVLDAGHGGIDSGAVSDFGLEEKDVVLDITNYILYWNKVLFEDKYDFYLTRSSDTLISLGDRTKLTKYLKPDIFISLHCNHIDDSSVKGIELYTYDANKFSLLYAESISGGLSQNLGFKAREVKQAYFQVLRETKEHCPAVLLELGYLSNSDESDYLDNSENRKALALTILRAI
jgi:N-acetylmuramoyl-L-alanine amidase